MLEKGNLLLESIRQLLDARSPPIQACYNGIQAAVDAITDTEGDVWIIRSVEVPATVTLTKNKPEYGDEYEYLKSASVT